jgi:hypothetical protein
MSGRMAIAVGPKSGSPTYGNMGPRTLVPAPPWTKQPAR